MWQDTARTPLSQTGSRSIELLDTLKVLYIEENSLDFKTAKIS